jgi:adenosine/AMP kinase
VFSDSQPIFDAPRAFAESNVLQRAMVDPVAMVFTLDSTTINSNRMQITTNVCELSSILKIAAGHTFLILFTNAYPINVINNVRNVSEVAVIYCATSNPVQVIVAKVDEGRSVVGIVDGLSSRSIEGPDDKQKRSKLLRELGYKK